MIKRVAFDEYGNPTEIEFTEGVATEVAANAFIDIRRAIKQAMKPTIHITPIEDGTVARNKHWYSEESPDA